MNYEEIRQARLRKPFLPFILRMKNGDEHLIPDPVNLAISKRVMGFVNPRTGIIEQSSPDAVDSLRFIEEAKPSQP